MSLTLTKLCDLGIKSASGLVFSQDHYYIIADDELFLSEYSTKFQDQRKISLFEGELPDTPEERKKLKPDLEAIFLDQNKIVCLPSGSKKRRSTGVWQATEQPEPFSLQELYSHLEESYSELNIEGAILKDSTLVLFQRGNGALAENGLIFLDYTVFKKELTESKVITKKSLLKHFKIDLGSLGNIPYSFNDAALDSQGKVYFLASAEDSSSTYHDGEFKGAILGKLDTSFNVSNVLKLDIETKPEGLWIHPDGSFRIVTDSDSSLPSTAYSGALPF